MTRKTGSLAILFADVAKSTHIYETLGNKDAKSLIDYCIDLMTKVTVHYNGTVIKTIGDEIMCTFPTANDAVEAAVEMNLGLEDIPPSRTSGFDPPNIYVGIQYGSVIMEGGDVFGDAVNVAARMVALAKQRQIITTDETVKLLSPERQSSAQCIDKTTVKGKSGELLIYEIIWEEHDLTVMVDDAAEVPSIKARLEVQYRGETQVFDENNPSATLGRQIHNDVAVNDNRVSRSHARIEYRRGKFVIIDQSSNGTFVIFQGKKSIHLKRDETQLLGSGLIGLGREVTPDSEVAIHFAIKF
ncbi:adenylate/guanylate cyclase domain-containing protein [Thermodesulfobacteriota bacterium]